MYSESLFQEVWKKLSEAVAKFYQNLEWFRFFVVCCIWAILCKNFHLLQIVELKSPIKVVNLNKTVDWRLIKPNFFEIKNKISFFPKKNTKIYCCNMRFISQRNLRTWTEDIRFDKPKILAQSDQVDWESKKPSVSISKTTTSSPSLVFSRKGLDQIVIPDVSLVDPEQREMLLEILFFKKYT